MRLFSGYSLPFLNRCKSFGEEYLPATTLRNLVEVWASLVPKLELGNQGLGLCRIRMPICYAIR